MTLNLGVVVPGHTLFWFERAESYHFAYADIEQAVAAFIADSWDAELGEPSGFNEAGALLVSAVKHLDELYWRVSFSGGKGKGLCRNLVEVREAAAWFDEEWCDNFSFMRGRFDAADFIQIGLAVKESEPVPKKAIVGIVELAGVELPPVKFAEQQLAFEY